MIKRIKSIYLTKRDKDVLHYLFENRGATISEIKNMFFSKTSRKNVSRRLKKLQNAKLIKMDTSIDLKCRYFYYITNDGLELCYPKNSSIKGMRLKPPNIEHDFTMSKIRNIFSKSRIIFNYYTENMLFHNYYQLQLNEILNTEDALIPDALIETKDENGPIYTAIELEISEKGPKIYKKKIQDYYFNSKIDYVIVITKSNTVRNIIMNEEKKLYPQKNKKLFYGELSEFFERKLPFVFENSSGIEYKIW